MKKLLITIFILNLSLSAFASGVLPPGKCSFPSNAPLTPDSGSGLSYFGQPIKWGTDGVGFNANYIDQVYIKLNSDGSSRVQINVVGKNTASYNFCKSDSSTGAIGISTITFQDSGIVMPKSASSKPLNRDVDVATCNWLIVGVFNLNALQTSEFRSGFSTWNQGKLPKTQISSTEEYYWK